MLQALLARDAAFEGIFFTGVVTTGIFCRPTCPARTPRPENVEFFPRAKDALAAGFRPCRRCRPLLPAGAPPEWLDDLLREVESDPDRRWSDRDLRALGLGPERVRRWFRRHHGMTFHDYARARRLGRALNAIRGGAAVSRTAYDHGYESLSGFNAAFKNVLGAAPTAAKDAAVVTVDRLLTPLGPMVAGATEEGLCLLEFADRRMLETQLRRLTSRLSPCVFATGRVEWLDRIEDELNAYFAGRLRSFTTPLLLLGTPFQESVWRALLQIPWGETRSYGELAARIGRPSAVRAVARANGDNRLAIVVPCHRVIGADGKLTGYGGGLWRKQRLLEIELQTSLGI